MYYIAFKPLVSINLLESNKSLANIMVNFADNIISAKKVRH